jgi:hypothetical protein
MSQLVKELEVISIRKEFSTPPTIYMDLNEVTQPGTPPTPIPPVPMRLRMEEWEELGKPNVGDRLRITTEVAKT